VAIDRHAATARAAGRLVYTDITERFVASYRQALQAGQCDAIRTAYPAPPSMLEIHATIDRARGRGR
jgi:hypothetical protein